MDLNLKSWSETNRFVWCPYRRRDGRVDGDVACRQGLITGADDGSGLVAIVSVADDGELCDIEALARVSLRLAQATAER